MVERELRRIVLFQARCVSNFSTSKSAGNLLLEGFLVAELLEERLVKEVLDVPGVVEGRARGGGLRSLLLVARFTRIDSLDTEVLASHFHARVVEIHTLEDT